MAKIVFLFNNKKPVQFLQEKKDCFTLTYAANGQSNKQPTIINYDSRIVMTINLPSLRLYESRITIVDCLLDLPLAFLLNGVPYGLLLLPPCCTFVARPNRLPILFLSRKILFIRPSFYL